MPEIVNFTPWSALAGGVLIGIAAALLLAGSGRIAGVSGILHGLVAGGDTRSWRLLFLLGLVGGAAVYALLFPGDIEPRQGFPLPLLVGAGLLVGVGTRLGSGCTSGHGVCGIARFSRRSLIATAVFMAVGVLSAILLRHGLGIAP